MMLLLLRWWPTFHVQALLSEIEKVRSPFLEIVLFERLTRLLIQSGTELRTMDALKSGVGFHHAGLATAER
jgi:hypothetical protein